MDKKSWQDFLDAAAAKARAAITKDFQASYSALLDRYNNAAAPLDAALPAMPDTLAAFAASEDKTQYIAKPPEPQPYCGDPLGWYM